MAHVQTVLGPIPPDSLGFTLPHEHTQISLWHVQARWDYWQLTRDEPVILDELARFRAAGGSGLVDLTPPGVGRDPEWLRGIATASGLHIVMGCGWYRTAYYPAEARIDRRTVDDLANEMVREATHGVGETGVRPGIIGEIGTSEVVTPGEERVLRAAARAQATTGAPLSIHHEMFGRKELTIVNRFKMLKENRLFGLTTWVLGAYALIKNIFPPQRRKLPSMGLAIRLLVMGPKPQD